MTLYSEKRTQAALDVIAPSATRAHLRSFNQAELLDAAMIVLNRPRVASPFDSLQIAHLDMIGRPPFNVAVCGNYLEDAHQAIAFEPDNTATLANLDCADGTQALSIGIDFAVRFQTSQPDPVKRANQLQVIKARIPAIEDHASGLKATLVSFFHHCREVIVLGQRVFLLVKDAIVNRHVTVAIGPEQSDQVDACDHLMVLARP